MISLRIRLLCVVACAMILFAVLVFSVVGKNYSDINDQFEADALGAQAKVVASLWEGAGGCSGETSSFSFQDLDNVFHEETGIAFKVICDANSKFVQSYGFPEIELSENSIDYLFDAEIDVDWLVAKKTVKGGAVYTALAGELDFDGYFIANAAGLALLTLAFLALLLIVYFLIGKALSPINLLTERFKENLEPVETVDLPVELNSLEVAVQKIVDSDRATQSKNRDLLSSERRFTANAAHELLTPLAAIKTEIQLQERLTEDKALKLWLAELSKRVNRATHTVDQLITLARLEPGTKPETTSRLNLNHVIADILDDLRDKVKRKNLKIHGLESEVIIHGSPTLISTLMRNLLSNAIRYTPIDGNITIESSISGDARSVRVTNDCKELPEYLTTHMFDRFVRGPHETETGSGLGLAIAQKIAEAHDANVRIDVAQNRKSISFSVQNLSETPSNSG